MDLFDSIVTRFSRFMVLGWFKSRYFTTVGLFYTMWGMFSNLIKVTIIEHVILRISHGALIISKRSKMCGLYVLYDFTCIGNASIDSKNFHYKIKLWNLKLRHASKRGLIELIKPSLLGSEKLNKLYFMIIPYHETWKQHKLEFRNDTHNYSITFFSMLTRIFGVR